MKQIGVLNHDFGRVATTVFVVVVMAILVSILIWRSFDFSRTLASRIAENSLEYKSAARCQVLP
jgi:hypothetical protein